MFNDFYEFCKQTGIPGGIPSGLLQKGNGEFALPSSPACDPTERADVDPINPFIEPT